MATVEELERRIQQLEARMTEAEDERAIRELLARYGYTADVKKDKEYIDLYTEDGVMNLGSGSRPGYEAIRRWEGKKGLWEFITDVQGHRHPAQYGNRMHAQGNNVVCHIDGDTAVVNSYSIVLLRSGDDVLLNSAGNNQWTMKKIDGKWHIKERRRRHIGGEEYHVNLDATPA